MPDIIERMAERALQGDVAAARLLLERSVPPLRPVEPLQAFNLPQAGLGEQARAIVALGASGGLSVGQVAQLVGAISTLGRMVEVEALEARLAALENRLETQGNL